MRVEKITPLDKATLEEIGLEWHSDTDGTPYIADELVVVSDEEAQRYYEAGNELYDMFVEAAEYVIENDLFFELDIPNTIVPMIKQSFEEDIHWHLYGRFDFAGGLDGAPIKLLEFNADTPTMLYESAVVQWALLKHNKLDESLQFNNIFDSISENFKRMITLGGDVAKFDALYEGWRILFASIAGNVEEERTTKFLQEIATSAGFGTQYATIEEVVFSIEEGASYQGQNYEFLFKLIPWEDIAIDEPELALIMQGMMEHKNTIFLNPAYTLLFQSKRMLKILWDLYPHHPLLLESSYEPLSGKKQVCKRAFGREGANVEILSPNGTILQKNDGIYHNHKPVFQEFATLNTHAGQCYQANVFFAYESCGLGFRRGGEIIDNYSKFVSHRLG